jgi:LIM domain kinase 1
MVVRFFFLFLTVCLFLSFPLILFSVADMSPEILLGQPFTLSTDVYSFGILLLEIASRSLASNHNFVRQLPDYGISHSEAWNSVSPACPKAFVELALECCATDPAGRPDTKEILKRLRVIELEVLEIDAQGMSTGEQDAHARGRSIKRKASIIGNVGSISYAGTTKKGSYGALASTRPTRPSAPRLPSFEGQVTLKFGSSFISSATSSSTPGGAHGDAAARKVTPVPGYHPRRGDSPGGSEDDDEEALLALAEAQVPIDFEHGEDDLTSDSAYFERLRQHQEGDDDEKYSISVVKPPPSGRSTILSSGGGGGDRPYGALGSTSGSSLLNTLERGVGQGSLPSLPPSWVAASREARDDGTRTVIASSPSPAGSNTPEKSRPFSGDDEVDEEQEARDVVSYLTTRTSTLSVAQAVVGGGRRHRLEPSSSSTALAVENEGDYDEDEESRDVFHSTLQSPARARAAQEYAEADEEADDLEGEVIELPHRFSLIKCAFPSPFFPLFRRV